MELHGESFDEFINKDNIIVDFYAKWCGPCRMLSPIIEEVSKEENIELLKVDVDEHPDIAKRYGIMSIPTIILFKNGNEVKKNIGFLSKDELLEFIK